MAVAQDPVQGVHMWRKEGFAPWPLVTDDPVQMFPSLHQVETSDPVLTHTPQIETLRNEFGFLTHLPWMADFTFGYFPLFEKGPDFPNTPFCKIRDW